MKVVNYGDPFTHRLTLRLTEKQFDFLTNVASLVGTSPSDYLRMMVNATMVTTSKSVDKLLKGEVGMSNENVEADKHDFV